MIVLEVKSYAKPEQFKAVDKRSELVNSFATNRFAYGLMVMLSLGSIFLNTVL